MSFAPPLKRRRLTRAGAVADLHAVRALRDLTRALIDRNRADRALGAPHGARRAPGAGHRAVARAEDVAIARARAGDRRVISHVDHAAPRARALRIAAPRAKEITAPGAGALEVTALDAVDQAIAGGRAHAVGPLAWAHAAVVRAAYLTGAPGALTAARGEEEHAGR
jgi:hypothetical protein